MTDSIKPEIIVALIMIGVGGIACGLPGLMIAAGFVLMAAVGLVDE